MKFQLTLLSTALASSTAHTVPSLTLENYDSLTAGKTVFLKFFAPWCGHCKKMAPDWEKLSEEWDGHSVGLVAEVDCTAEGKALCDANGVQGFPSLKHGDPASLEDYKGGRTYDDLAKFATENLKPVCSVTNIDLCDDEKKKQINSFLEMSTEKLENAIVDEEEALIEIETKFTDAVNKLQAEYQQLTEDKETATAAVKNSGLGLMKSVLATKLKEEEKDEL